MQSDSEALKQRKAVRECLISPAVPNPLFSRAQPVSSTPAPARPSRSTRHSRFSCGSSLLSNGYKPSDIPVGQGYRRLFLFLLFYERPPCGRFVPSLRELYYCSNECYSQRSARNTSRSCSSGGAVSMNQATAEVDVKQAGQVVKLNPLSDDGTV